ncbi:MAG: B12-binding domain-containing radical SAM protein [Desulfuromonas sp.]|uniref:B12-binding domain-containing radical SAM protein n=1 Tax=Desulfuromonas sp. TaxID=892 RepID=UPI000CC21D4F|nr:radical SAM protein [Desulfuromonas sp.]PLX84938.1 MAG: B12-binding domain-containing radical SAM protein [Desulfuromonas sp.]
MRILLIHPPSSIGFIDRVYMHEPLALEYLGAGLKLDGHEVMLHDARIDPDVLAAARGYRPQVVALTGYTSQANIVKALAGQLKALDPAPTVVVGGHHATVRPADFNVPAIDLVVVGEGVTALRQIARELAGEGGFETIDGLAIPGEEMRFTPARPHPGLDELPLPDRTLSARYRDHYFSEWLRPLASVRTSLGCTARCNFCALWSLTGAKYLRRQPEKVVEELRSIEEENVFFCDDESMCDVGRMDRLAELIAASGIRKKYFLYARVDTIVRHPQLFAKWRDVGLQQVFVGMESFSDANLERMNKGVTVAQQEEAVRILRKIGILLYASFVVDPDFSREDFRCLTAYVRRLKLHHASFSVLTPLPGTALYEERQGELLPYRPELFDFIHTVLPTRLPLAEFYAEFARLWQRAVPPHRALKTFSRYGLRRLPGVFRLLGEAMAAMRKGHLDHD